MEELGWEGGGGGAGGGGGGGGGGGNNRVLIKVFSLGFWGYAQTATLQSAENVPQMQLKTPVN